MRNLWLVLSVLIIIADYYTKLFAIEHLRLHHSVEFMPFVNFTLTYNTGAAFGFMSTLEPSWERWTLAAISLIATLFFLNWFFKSKHTIQRAGLALVMGGALGNFIDRVFYGRVTDFIDLYVNQYHWPAFNLADSAICIGVGLLLISWVKYERHHQ